MASSGLISRAAWHTDDENSHRSKDLEEAQSPAEERRRSAVSGTDADLTELAVPRLTVEAGYGDDLEKEEAEPPSHCHRKKSMDDEDNELTEIAIPEPVAHQKPHEQSCHRSLSEDVSKEEQAEKKANPASSPTPSSELSIVAWLIFFSFWGTLARLGVEAIATYPYAAVSSPVLWANLGGALLMGFLVEDRRLFRAAVPRLSKTVEDHELSDHINKHQKTLPLYIGLATGFCGSFTSFSTYITDAFLALSNDLTPASPSSPYDTISAQDILPRNGGYSFEALVAVLILHPMVGMCALKTGAHLAVGLESVTPTLPARFIQKYLDKLIIPVSLGCWIGAVLLTIFPVHVDWRRRATMALVFAPPGCLLRFYAGRHLNARIPSFPLGTFVVNIFGTVIEGMCYDLQHAHSIVGQVQTGNAASCAVLEGVMQGFCGCATTVSTWVAELNGLRRRHGWLYGIVTVGVALGLQVAVMGSVRWTIGFDNSCSS